MENTLYSTCMISLLVTQQHNKLPDSDNDQTLTNEFTDFSTTT